MKTRCNKCRKLIPYGETYCDNCIKVVRKANRTRNKEAEDSIKNSRWQSLRMDIIRRDKCCIPCYLQGFINAKSLQVHHIVKRVDNPDLIYEPTNLITVCRTCHEEVEKLSVAQQLELFKDCDRELKEYRLL